LGAENVGMTRFAPWAGWVGGIVGWLATHQFGSDFVQLNCSRAASPLMLLVSLLGAGIALVGAQLSLRVWRRDARIDLPFVKARRFIAGTGVLAAGLFLLAILFQMPSSLIVPRCFG
jgi:hypothetical protein